MRPLCKDERSICGHSALPSSQIIPPTSRFFGPLLPNVRLMSNAVIVVSIAEVQLDKGNQQSARVVETKYQLRQLFHSNFVFVIKLSVQTLDSTDRLCLTHQPNMTTGLSLNVEGLQAGLVIIRLQIAPIYPDQGDAIKLQTQISSDIKPRFPMGVLLSGPSVTLTSKCLATTLAIV